MLPGSKSRQQATGTVIRAMVRALRCGCSSPLLAPSHPCGMAARAEWGCCPDALSQFPTKFPHTEGGGRRVDKGGGEGVLASRPETRDPILQAERSYSMDHHRILLCWVLQAVTEAPALAPPFQIVTHALLICIQGFHWHWRAQVRGWALPV